MVRPKSLSIGALPNDDRFQAHYPLLSQQFSRPSSSSGLLADGNTDFFSFSTGRRNVASLHTVFKLLPRHDIAKRLYQFGWEMIDLVNTQEDEIELDFKLFPSATPNFVWGIVRKDYLAKIKQGRWDLVSQLRFMRVQASRSVSKIKSLRHSLGRLKARFSVAATASCQVSKSCFDFQIPIVLKLILFGQNTPTFQRQSSRAQDPSTLLRL